jgi:ketosteroid isomerase-like protein
MRRFDRERSCVMPSTAQAETEIRQVTRGAEAYANNWLLAYEMFEGPMEIDVRDMVIHAGEDVAFLYMLEYFVHEHGSVPIDMKNDKPLLNEQP